MNKQPEIPSAFPVMENSVYTESLYLKDSGMTLRDYFAGQAMLGSLASGTIKHGLGNDVLASSFYSLADAMLKERSKINE